MAAEDEAGDAELGGELGEVVGDALVAVVLEGDGRVGAAVALCGGSG